MSGKVGILSKTNNVLVINDKEEINQHKEILKAHKKFGIVIQTTQTIAHVQTIINELIPIAKELKIENTICPSTTNRQKETLELAKSNDLVIVVGSKTSANTTHLAQICEPITKTIHVETENDLDNYKDFINKVENIAITAGASTPQSLIEKVIKKIEKENI